MWSDNGKDGCRGYGVFSEDVLGHLQQNLNMDMAMETYLQNRTGLWYETYRKWNNEIPLNKPSS